MGGRGGTNGIHYPWVLNDYLNRGSCVSGSICAVYVSSSNWHSYRSDRTI